MKAFAIINLNTFAKTAAAGLLVLLFAIMPRAASSENRQTFDSLIAESYVNDVPFDTREVVMNYYFDNVSEKVHLKSDKETNDFPFNTACVANLYFENAQAANPFTSPDCRLQPKEVKSITKANVSKKYSAALLGFALPPEVEADDIPFNTAQVVADYINSSMKESSTVSDNLYKIFATNQVRNFLHIGVAALVLLAGAGLLAIMFFNFLY